MPMSEHLARHRLADLFIDTLPYNAHTTASDALWAGLPVLTCMGQSFAARVAASLLLALDLPELITRSQTEFEARAISLAQNATELAAIAAKLQNNRASSPLFDAKRFARHIEKAFEIMHTRHLDALPPASFHVSPLS
jgi:predicted O-linked N-acetylglucosamine transferase (SPINDLY family)